MAARDAEVTLPLALRSLQAQSWDDWELLLYDDGSRDGTRAIMEATGDPRVRVFAEARSRGLACRLNQAIDAAEGELFARMDADDVAFPRRLEHQVAFLRSHPEVDLLATGAIVIDARNRPLGLFPCDGEDHEAICAHPHTGFYFPHPTWMGRIQWFRRFRYRDGLRKAEDQDLLLRAYRLSRFALLPTPLLGYRQDRLSLRKALSSRAASARVLAAAFVAQEAPLTAMRAVAGQLLKGGLELGALALGLSPRVLRWRRRALAEEELAATWAACLDQLERADGAPSGEA
jgi:glycosyltransferase involved in cell wall biosynthesis